MPVVVVSEAHINADARKMLADAIPVLNKKLKPTVTKIFALEQALSSSLEAMISKMEYEVNGTKTYLAEVKKQVKVDPYKDPRLTYELLKLNSGEYLLNLLSAAKKNQFTYQGIDMEIDHGRTEKENATAAAKAFQLLDERSQLMANNLIRLLFANPDAVIIALIGGYHAERMYKCIVELLGETQAERHFKFLTLNYPANPVLLPYVQVAKPYVNQVLQTDFRLHTDKDKLERLGIRYLSDKDPEVHKRFVEEVLERRESKQDYEFSALRLYYTTVSFAVDKRIKPNEKNEVLRILKEAYQSSAAPLSPTQEEALRVMIKQALYRKTTELAAPKNWGALFCCRAKGSLGFRLALDKHARVAFTGAKVAEVMGRRVG